MGIKVTTIIKQEITLKEMIVQASHNKSYDLLKRLEVTNHNSRSFKVRANHLQMKSSFLRF